jgi:hypothetical protein
MIRGAGHNDAELFTGETMITGILRFVEDLGPTIP